jgi:hypothetical protein
MRMSPPPPEVLSLVIAWSDVLHLPLLARLALRWGHR